MTIVVSARVRPPIKRRRKAPSQHIKVSQDGRTLFVSRNPQLIDNDRWSTPVVSKKFSFDETFSEHSSQCDVYDALIQENVQKAFEGHNFSVFTIGQSRSGKSHTLIGNARSRGVGESRGIIPRAMEQMLDTIKAVKTRENSFQLKVSLFRVDNEVVFDVLGKRSGLKIVETSERSYGTHVAGAFEKSVSDLHHVSELIDAFQNAHQQSLTGHLVWSVLLERTHLDESAAKGYGTWRTTVISRMHFIETAAMERSKEKDSKFARNARRNLARSFDALCTVVHFLHREDAPHVPYRNSKLTHLAKDCIGTSSDTILIHCVSPLPKDMAETVHTLTFAKKICDTCGKNKPPRTKAFLPDKMIKRSPNTRSRKLKSSNASGNRLPLYSEDRLISPSVGSTRGFGSPAKSFVGSDSFDMLGTIQRVRRYVRATGHCNEELEMLHKLENQIHELIEENLRLHAFDRDDPNLCWANSEILSLQQETLKYQNQFQLLQSEVDALNNERNTHMSMNQEMLEAQEERLGKEVRAREEVLQELNVTTNELRRYKSDAARLEGEVSVWRKRYENAVKANGLDMPVEISDPSTPVRETLQEHIDFRIDSGEIIDAFRSDISLITQEAEPTILDKQIADLDRDFRRIQNEIENLESMQDIKNGSSWNADPL